jgi:WD40 repeat protein/serine/threonine protein kinase
MGVADDLLFGLLALQNGLIDQSQLVAAFHAWTRDRARSLADHLEALGHLDADQRAAVDAMVALHLKRHGGDAEKSLAAIPAGHSTRDRLADLGDPQIDATLQFVASRSTETDTDSTTSFSIGSATSDGQRFRVLRAHARGGLGAVFVALDGELNREVALKQILDHHADDPVSRHRFLVEAEVTGGLEHPGIVPVYGLGTYADGRPFYAMRFIKGESLKEAIATFHADESLTRDPGRRSLELRQLLRRFLDVCNAIEYAHARGVLHRDIKPGNIIVGKYGETLVVDWGLAKATGKSDPSADERTLMPSSASGSADTLPGSAVGTPAYMSPEQARGELEALGPRSDEYSLGATLYCLLTGKPPYEGDDIGAILRRVQKSDFAPLRQVDPAIDRSLEAVCLKAMATRPGDRYASCRALADDIERWLADEPVTARREPLRERASRWLRKHPVATSAAAATLVMGLAAALYGLSRERTFSTSLAQANTALNQQRLRAEQQGEALRRQNAVASVKLALHEFEGDNIAEAEKQLEECPSDRRFMEWNLVKRLCHRERQSFDDHRWSVCGVAFSPGGDRIASVGGSGQPGEGELAGQGELVIRDAASGRILFERRGLRHGPRAAAFEPASRGRYLATGGGLTASVTEGRLDVWDTESGACRTLDQVVGHCVNAIAYSPDGAVLAAAYEIEREPGTAGYARIWDIATGKPMGEPFSGHSDSVCAVAFSPDGRWLALASAHLPNEPGKIEIWDWRKREQICPPFRTDDRVNCLAFSPDGRFLAFGGFSPLIRIWDVMTWKEVRTFKGHPYEIRDLRYSPDGKILASCSEDRLVKLWDMATGLEHETLRGHPGKVLSLAFGAGGRSLVSGDASGRVMVWDVEQPRPLRLKVHCYYPNRLAFHPDRKRLVTSAIGGENAPELWDLDTGRLLRSFQAHSKDVYAVSLNCDGSLLATGSYDGTVRIWDVESGRQLDVLDHGQGVRVMDVAFHLRDSSMLATACDDGTLRLWTIDPTGRSTSRPKVLARLDAAIQDLAFRLPLGQQLAAGVADGSVHVWYVETITEIRVIPSLGDRVLDVVFSPDGRLLATVNDMGRSVPDSASLYDMEAGITRITLPLASGTWSVAFSPDGTRMATLGTDYMLRLWDSITGQEVLTIRDEKLGGKLYGPIAFSPDGRRLLVGCIGVGFLVLDVTPWAPDLNGR